jgi:hypothetical protein
MKAIAASMKTSVLGHRIVVILVLGWGACCCANKTQECRALGTSLSALGERLAEAHMVVSASEVQPTEVAAALKPFAAIAKTVAESLNAKVPKVSSLRKISKNAAAAALALSSQSAQMAEYAEQMKDLDAASKVVDDNKQRVDKLELQIKESCDADSDKCVDLSEVLARFPAPTDQSEVTEDAAAWARKMSVWTADLAGVHVQDHELKGLVQGFVKGWQDLSVGMLRLVTILELGKKYEELTKDFNVQIERANQAIAEANNICQK